MKNNHNIEQQLTQLPIASSHFLSCAPDVGEPSPLTDGGQASGEQPTRYVDTADYQLLRTGLVARLAAADDQLLLTVENTGADLAGKVTKAIQRRVTLTEPITCADDALAFKSWPKALRKTVAPLLPKHTKFHVILTMAQDTAQASPDNAFPQLAEKLVATSRQTPDTLDASGIQPQMLVAEACRLIWREQLMTMLLNEAGVRYSEERDYVHNMRVAIRRARAAAKLYGYFFPRKRLRPYLHFLRETGRLLGEVRNLDVTLAKARRARTDETAGAQVPKKWVKTWRAQRKVAHEALLVWLDSREYSELLADFQAFCTAPTTPLKHDLDPATPQQVRHVIPMQIAEGFAAVRAYETLFETDTAVAPELLHNLRIDCKHLRYNLEFVRHLLGPECEAMITRLKALQEILGELNDAVIAQALVAESKETPDTLVYQQVQVDLVEEVRRQTPAALAELVNQESREQLGRALARL